MALKTARINLYIYSGTEGSYTADDLKYRLTKDVMGDDGKVVIEIGELVNDYIDNTYTGGTETSQTMWATVRAALYDANGNELTDSPHTFHYLAVEGYGDFEQGINPNIGNHVMQSNDIVYVPEGEQAVIPVFAESLSDLTFYNGSSNIGSQTISDDGDSDQKIQHVTLPANCTKAVFDSDQERTIQVEYICEAVHKKHRVTFINKFGALQHFWFFKKNTKRLSITDETFKSNIISIPDETYSINKGQISRYNVNAKTRITVNTGYIDESLNDVIEQLLMSEKVWMKVDDQTLAVIPQSKSLTYKTATNDKLINYSIDFEFAFDKYNLIR